MKTSNGKVFDVIGRFSSFLWKASLLGLLAFGLLYAGNHEGTTQSSGADGDEFKVGVVNVDKVFSEYEGTKKVKKDLLKKKKQIEKEIEKISEEIDRIETELNELEPLSKAWKKQAQKLYQLRARLKVHKNIWKQDTTVAVNRSNAKIYNKIRNTIEEYAKKNGFDLVLKSNSPRLETKNAQDTNKKIAERSVLYFSNRMDLTGKIVEILNRKFSENQQNENDG